MTIDEFRNLRVGDVVRYQWDPYVDSRYHVLIVNNANLHNGIHLVHFLFLISSVPVYSPGDIWGDLGEDNSDDIFRIERLELIQ